MKNRLRLMAAQYTAIVLSLIMAFTIFPMSVSAETGDGDNNSPAAGAEAIPDFVPGQLIVVTEHSTSTKQMKSIARQTGGQIDTISTLGNGSRVALIEVKEGSELDTAATLEREDKVLFVQPNYIYTPEEAATGDTDSDPVALRNDPGFPDDPLYGEDQAYLSADPTVEGEPKKGSMNAKGAWDKLAELDELGELDGREKPIVAVLDSGVRLDHEDLQKGLIDEDLCTTFNGGVQMRFEEEDNADDDEGHGTRVSGIIGANLNNGKGIAGVAGNRVKLFVVDVVMPDTFRYESIDVALGLDYAVRNGAKLINMSFHTAFGRDYICEIAMKDAWNKGALCICSAGNDMIEFLHSPGDCPYAVTVMGHTWKGAPARFTNYGIEDDVSAPGYVTSPYHDSDHSYIMSYDNKPATGSGTSFSAALVTGAAALLLVANPDLTPREIKNLLYTSSGKWGFSANREGQCFGMVNINTAMGNLLAKKTTPEKIVINKPVIEMYAGTDTSIEYAIYPGNTNTTDVTFTSSDENVVKVDADGTVTAVAPGKATIRLISKAVSAKCNVTVKEIPYQTIDQKPYRAEGTITLNDMTDIVEEVDENNVPVSKIGFLHHRYHVNLKKNETIDAVMSSEEHYSFLRIKNKDNMVVASGDVGAPKSYSRVTYTAEQAGTYQLQTFMQINRLSWPNKPAADYDLVLTSDKSFCEPTVDSIDNGEMHMQWPAVDNANGYYVRKYADKGLTQIEFEDKISETEFTDTAFDKNKANYYSVTSYVKTKAGELRNGVTPLVIKMQNPMTAKAKVKTVKVKAKKLKKKSIKVKRTKYLRITNAKGKLTYTKVKGKKKITVSKKTGRLKIKKGLKKGKYTVKVKIRDAGNEEYNAATRTVTFKVRVR